MFPQRICLDLGLGWYRCNRQYVQGSGKLVLKLSGFRELQCLEVIMTCLESSTLYNTFIMPWFKVN